VASCVCLTKNAPVHSCHAVFLCVAVRLGKNVLVERCGVMYKNCGTEHQMIETACFTLSRTMGHVFRCIRADEDYITVYVDPAQLLLQQSCESCKKKRLKAASKEKRLHVVRSDVKRHEPSSSVVAIPPPPPSILSMTTSVPNVGEPPEHAVRMQNLPRGFDSFTNNMDPEKNLSGSFSLSNRRQGLSQAMDPTDEDDSWVLLLKDDDTDGISGMPLEQEDTTAMLLQEHHPSSSWSRTSSMRDRNSRVSGISSLSIDDEPKTSSFLKGLFKGESNDSWTFEVDSFSCMPTIDECQNPTDVLAGRSMSEVLERSSPSSCAEDVIDDIICCSAVEMKDTHATRGMHRSSGTTTFVAAPPELSSMVFH
jgi:hypothetical protein